MRLVSRILRVTFWIIFFGIVGLLLGATIGLASDQSPSQSALIGAALIGLFGLIYGLMTPNIKPKPLPQPGRTKYGLEPCAWCNGTGTEGRRRKKPCGVCVGHGNVLVRQPPFKCPECDGKGRKIMARRCKVCNGSGWLDYLLPDQNLRMLKKRKRSRVKAGS